ncbi:flagellar biosynthesis protein FlhF-like protein [Henriciella sp.]|uniref:flagellar biosynthesis protein FlhF n=1 Tax=Henriciella sp. TaxID=1968823 RepID=UPI002629A2E4|nr:flagellar biosynthesis protein FlhF-like protein [Henriciella sp.]
MRMKMFAAETFEAAKSMIFAEMGDDAIILSEREVPGGVEVRAATDKLGGGMVPSEPRFLSRINNRQPAPGRPQDNPLRNRVRDALTWHGAPQRFAERVADAGMPASARTQDPAEIMASGLDALITCDPIAPLPAHDILLVGPPGHGRTATAAKMTRRAAVAKTQILPVAADLDATAGGAQLAAYLELEQRQVRTARTPDDLFNMLRDARRGGHRCVIDLPAIVPYDEEDMASLGDLINAIDAEPVLIMSAEGHPEDQAEAARAFAEVGVRRAIVTKLDVTRRRGGVVAALSGAGLAFSHLAITPFIGGGLIPAAPGRLSRILLEESPADVALKGAA